MKGGKTLQALVAIILTMALTMAMAVAASADPAGQVNYPGGGQFQPNQLVQALATASGETTAQIKQDMAKGQNIEQVARHLAQEGAITQSSLATAIEQAMAGKEQQMASNLLVGIMGMEPPVPKMAAVSF